MDIFIFENTEVGVLGLFGMIKDAQVLENVKILIDKKWKEQEPVRILAKVKSALVLLSNLRIAVLAAVSVYESFEYFHYFNEIK